MSQIHINKKTKKTKEDYNKKCFGSEIRASMQDFVLYNKIQLFLLVCIPNE